MAASYAAAQAVMRAHRNEGSMYGQTTPRDGTNQQMEGMAIHTGGGAVQQPKEPKSDCRGCFNILRSNIFLTLMLGFIPLGIVAGHQKWAEDQVFLFNFLAVIPLAWLIGKATEDLACATGEVAGGLINASFGNIVEMLLCVAGIQRGELEVTKCTLIGSIISNLLLVMGCAFLVGGLYRHEQSFSQAGAMAQTSLMMLGSLAIGLPTLYGALLQGDRDQANMVSLSRVCSILLLFVYAAYLLFQLRTHAYMFKSDGEEGEEDEEEPDLSPWASCILLGIGTIATASCTDYLIEAIEGTVEAWELSKEFIGIILLPIIGNAAEHYTAITVAARDKMDLSLGVAAGSSCQMALLVTPFTVMVGWSVDQPMSLDFHPFQMAVLMLSMMIVSSILADGASNWLEGLLLLTAYAIISIIYFYESRESSLVS